MFITAWLVDGERVEDVETAVVDIITTGSKNTRVEEHSDLQAVSMYRFDCCCLIYTGMHVSKTLKIAITSTEALLSSSAASLTISEGSGVEVIAYSQCLASPTGAKRGSVYSFAE